MNKNMISLNSPRGAQPRLSAVVWALGSAMLAMSASAAEMQGHQHGATPAPTAEMSNMSGMQHGTAAPSKQTLRDPNAYADGYQIGVGAYAPSKQRLMHLADEHRFAGVVIDSLERAKTGADRSTRFDVQAWMGSDYNRVVLTSEGAIKNGGLEEASTHLWWSHAANPVWNTQLGVRLDTNTGPDRQWVGVGLQGLAPYWFEVEANAYVGSGGRTALRLKAENEWLLTQRWVVQPHTEWNFYGRSDVANGVGSGLSDATLGVRLRYDINRQVSPYIGVDWTKRFGKTADLSRAAGASTRDTTWRAGVRLWF